MSGRRDLMQAAVLAEIPIFLMDATTGEGVTGVDPGDTGFVVRYRRAGETSDTTLTMTAVAAGAAIAVNQWRDYGDGWYSVVGSVAMYATGARFVKLAVDCTTPATLADACVVALAADDALSASASTAAVAAAVRDELLTVRWGQQTQPVGGSTQILSITDMPSATALGVVRRYRDSGGVIVGQTELTAS